MDKKALSVCLITYNHGLYIRQAIESVLMQRVNFSWELIIADDCSNDNTREILKEYQEKHPGLIRLILQEKNVGPAQNWIDLMRAPESNYVAYFEGDDYWTDANKLQKQFDFMEQNKEFVMCFHNVTVINELTNTTHLFHKYDKSEYKGLDLFKKWIVPTVSVFFRNILPKELPLFFKEATHGDLALFLYMTQFGKIKLIDGVMAVYRINSNGATQSLLKGINHNLKHIKQLVLMKDFFGKQYEPELKQRIANYWMPTGYLYAKNGDRKNALMCFKNARKVDKAEALKGYKFYLASIYYFVRR
jgi:glycosyltransferase involved in cell wall biosynthesis